MCPAHGRLSHGWMPIYTFRSLGRLWLPVPMGLTRGPVMGEPGVGAPSSRSCSWDSNP